MTKSAFRFLLIIVSGALILGPIGLLWAQPPNIHIELNFNKSLYEYGEPIGVQVVVSNLSGKDILISQGFSSLVYYLEMRVFDPSGRLIIAKRDEVHDEFPDAPPLAWVLYNGHPIQVANCEVLDAGWVGQSQSEDLRAYYAFDLPGNYSAEVQLSAMIFKGEEGAFCNVNDYEWLGVLKSETKYFEVQGDTKNVKINPEKWKLSWMEDGQKEKYIEVQVLPDKKETIDDYDPQSIRLNNLEADSVRVLPPKIKAYFNNKAAIESLGEVQQNQWYWVLISGRYKSGKPFGAQQKILIVK